MQLLYGLKNLRSNDLPETELRPITILVGRNNSGKSTFLRSFPLLKQSISEQENGPISWYGNHVDYGDYNTAIKDGCEKDGITFHFGVKNFPIFDNWLRNDASSISNLESSPEINSLGTATGTINFKQSSQGIEITRDILFQVLKQKIHLSLFTNSNGETNIQKFNNKAPSNQIQDFSYFFRQNHILSKLSAIFKSDQKDIYFQPVGFKNVFADYLASLLSVKLKPRKLSMSEILTETVKILQNFKISPKTLTRLGEEAESKGLKDFYCSLKENQHDIHNKLNEVTGLFWTTLMQNRVCNIFDTLMTNSVYFRPTRGKDDRHFRIQNLDRMEILPEGENLSTFYENLTNEQICEFSSWLQEYFGFGLFIEKSQWHISIFIVEGGQKVNLADSGFGISEILPFLTQTWWELQKNNGDETSKIVKNASEAYNLAQGYELGLPKLMAIEQPELHLHPAHQAKLADVFVNSLNVEQKNTGIKSIFLIETHSSAFINRLGELVGKKQIDPNDINVLVFSKRVENSLITFDIVHSHYDENGYLRDWPYGFFRYSK